MRTLRQHKGKTHMTLKIKGKTNSIKKVRKLHRIPAHKRVVDCLSGGERKRYQLKNCSRGGK
jgi:Fe-S cluster assembly ATPase SufC